MLINNTDYMLHLEKRFISLLESHEIISTRKAQVWENESTPILITD